MIVNRSIGSYGRFCNGMFQVAAVIGVARKNGHEFGFEPWYNHDHESRFGSKEDCDLQKHFTNFLPVIDRGLPYQQINVNWGYEDLHLPRQNHYDIRGHFQSIKWFEHSLDEVRYYFSMPMEEEFPITAIHWRAGDYEDNENAYHPRLTIDYYKKAMEIIAGPYMVFSDDIEAAEKMFSNIDTEIWYCRGKDYINDFKVMKGCKHFITANSSYSLMAAILATHPEKKIVMPAKWFGDIAGLPTKDLYPSNAIII